MTTLIYNVGAQLPNAHLTVLDDTSTVVDFSSGYTFVVSVIDADTDTVAHTQSTGVTGAATEPNLTVAWTSGFTSVTAGRYRLKVVATISSKPRIAVFDLVVV